jgi:site-specific DNA-methyltransferase (adenine-specific)
MDRANTFFSPSVAFSSADDTWKTPPDFFAALDAEFGFTLDAAALNSSALCQEWYGPDHKDLSRRDAFKRDWQTDAHDGAVWLNPPYGRTIGRWMRKAHDESQKGLTVVCLVPSRTDTAWFQDFALTHEVRFVRSRLHFSGSDRAPSPSAVVVMKKKERKRK